MALDGTAVCVLNVIVNYATYVCIFPLFPFLSKTVHFGVDISYRRVLNMSNFLVAPSSFYGKFLR